MFITLKKNTIIAFLLCLFVLGGGFATYFAVSASTSPKPIHTIVIDAGHDGIDVKLGHISF